MLSNFYVNGRPSSKREATSLGGLEVSGTGVADLTCNF